VSFASTSGGGFGGGGGGTAFSGVGGGGAGMGGAIFNHTGTVNLLNVTAIGNAAIGGTSGTSSGSGLGAVLFNLHGTATIDFSTLAGNNLSQSNGGADSRGPEDGTVYSLGSLTIGNSIIHGTQADAAGSHDDVVANVLGAASSLVYYGSNLIGLTHTAGGASQSGTSPNTAAPQLGALSFYSASPNALPVLPIGSSSPAYNGAPSCAASDGVTTVMQDERGAARPYGGLCDIGAYEYDGDYIFANSYEQPL
jgi:hypothetical protein